MLTIGGDKAALYTDTLVADIVGKECHFTDPAWLLRVGVYLELLTCMGIIEAVRADVGDLLESDERDAFETSDAFSEIRRHVDARRLAGSVGPAPHQLCGIGQPSPGASNWAFLVPSVQFTYCWPSAGREPT